MDTQDIDIDLHPRTLRRNIWKALLCASDQEIHEGMHFYEGAYGLCRFFSRLHPDVSTEQVAGIYSALSPMNTWDTNVSNILDVLRDWSAASVNTTDVNLHKALQIRIGADPLNVLQGRKVRAFYRAISDPSDTTQIPVDRHLINLALGVFPDKSAQSRLASDPNIYTRVENAYLDLGRREKIGNRLASIAWFVQRRVSRDGQGLLHHPDSPVCCGRPMWGHGSERLKCPACGKSLTKQPKPKRTTNVQLDYTISFPLGDLRKLYPIVYLPPGHPHRNSAGWQYLARHIVMDYIGEKLHRDEHVHHINGDKFDCRRDNLKVMLAQEHGRFHGRYQLLYMLRDHAGKWAKSEVPRFSELTAQGEATGIDVEDREYDDIPF